MISNPGALSCLFSQKISVRSSWSSVLLSRSAAGSRVFGALSVSGRQQTRRNSQTQVDLQEGLSQSTWLLKLIFKGSCFEFLASSFFKSLSSDFWDVWAAPRLGSALHTKSDASDPCFHDVEVFHRGHIEHHHPVGGACCGFCVVLSWVLS